MKVLLVTQYFYPENFKSNDIAFELTKRGHSVTVLTGLPNYPEGKIYKGWGVFKRRNETINGVEVIRSLLVPRGDSNGVRLFLNYFSWAFFASITAFFLALREKFDCIIVHEPSPITQGFPAIVIKKIQKIPLHFWVLDLWPESLQSAGGINNKYIIRFFDKMVKYVYNNSDKILISSNGFRKSILEKGDYESKLEYFPNWSEDTITKGIDSYNIPQLPKGFKVLFAGNIGEAQDMSSILKAAKELKNFKNIHFIIVGDGRMKSWMDSYIVKEDLCDTVHLLGRFPIESMKTFFNRVDALLVSLKDEQIFNVTVPAKMQAYMSIGKPILTMLNGEGNEIIKKSKSGLISSAGDFESLARNILELNRLDMNETLKMGQNAKDYYDTHFDMNICMDNLELILKNNFK